MVKYVGFPLALGFKAFMNERVEQGICNLDCIIKATLVTNITRTLVF
jgi:hypothetical protein